MKFFGVITRKLLFSLGNKNLMEGVFLGGGEWKSFQLVGGGGGNSLLSLQQGKPCMLQFSFVDEGVNLQNQ